MTRSETLTRLAMMLAQQEGRVWQKFPNDAQARAQKRFENNASAVLVFIEGKMLDFKWTPES